MTVATYSPGAWYALVAPSTVLLVHPDVSGDLLAQLWRDVQEAGGGAALERFVAHPGVRVPFALATVEGERARLVLRGAMQATVQGTSGRERQVRGGGLAALREESVGLSDTVWLMRPGARRDGVGLPIECGTVLADVVVWDAMEALRAVGRPRMERAASSVAVAPEAPSVAPERAAAEVPNPRGQESPARPGRESPVPALAAVATEAGRAVVATEAGRAAVAPEAGRAAGSPVELVSGLVHAVPDQPAPAVRKQTTGPVGRRPALRSYRRRPKVVSWEIGGGSEGEDPDDVPSAAVVAEPEVREVAAPEVKAPEVASPEVAAPEIEVPAATPRRPASRAADQDDLAPLAEVPQVGVNLLAAARPPADHAGAAPTAAETEAPEPEAAETEAAEPEAPETEAAEPEVIGVLEFGDHEQVPMEGPVIIGRAPSRGATDQLAQLVVPRSAGRELSRSHVRFDVGRNGVFVMDLGSRNGTSITTPDGRHEVLAAWVPHLVQDGAVLSFAGVTCRFVAARG